MRGRLPVFAHPCQRIGAAEARWAHNPKVLRSKLRFAILSLLSRLAQLVERKTLNLVVVGSSPTVGVLSFCVSIFPAPREFITLVLPAGGALDTLPEWLRGSPAK